MEDREYTVQQLTQQWTGGTLQECCSIYNILADKGYTMDDLVKYVEGTNLQEHFIDGQFEAYHPCPMCDSPMNLFAVNTTPRNQIGDNYKSQWQCPHCKYDEFLIEKPATEWAKAKKKHKKRNN